MKLIFHSFPSGRAGIALSLIRLYLGIAFIQHGGGKLDDIAGFGAGAYSLDARLFGRGRKKVIDESIAT